eukprot:508951-Hanusia_phi.AAC.1
MAGEAREMEEEQEARAMADVSLLTFSLSSTSRHLSSPCSARSRFLSCVGAADWQPLPVAEGAVNRGVGEMKRLQRRRASMTSRSRKLMLAMTAMLLSCSCVFSFAPAGIYIKSPLHRTGLVRSGVSAPTARNSQGRRCFMPSMMVRPGSGQTDDVQQNAVNMELQNAIRLNDLLVIQDMIQADVVGANFALCKSVQLGGGEDMIEMILQLGASPDATDEFGRTALMLAVMQQDLDAAGLLLAAGADVEGIGKTYNGRTALMQAACSGSAELVKLLLSKGADPEAMDRYGRNVVKQAAMMKKEQVVRILEEHLEVGAKEEVARTRSTTSRVSQEEDDLIPVEEGIEQEIWRSILEESRPVQDRPEVFEWRGRILRQPDVSEDGKLCVIVDDETGEVVFKGNPPMLEEGNEEEAGAGSVRPDPTASQTSRTQRVVTNAARIAVMSGNPPLCPSLPPPPLPSLHVLPF